jgi:tetratricopeptide (TPR) repeat protein
MLSAPLFAIETNNVQFDRAQQLFNSARYQETISLLRNAQDPRSLELLGRSYLAEAQHGKATETLEKAVALQPQDSMLETWLARAYGHRAENSMPFNAIHYANLTREAFEHAVQLDPANEEALGDLFDFYLQAPAMVGGGLDKAEALLPKIATHDPVGFELAKAHLAEHTRQYPEAESHIRRAIDTAPRDPETQSRLYIDLAKFFARRTRYQESDEAFAHARNMAPNSPRIDFERAETYLRARRNKNEARELLKKYVASDRLTPEDPSRTDALQLLKKADGI